MTGFGRSVVDDAGTGASIRWAVEIRTTNHRGFDLKVRSEQPDAICESEITRLVRAAVERGTVAVAIRSELPGRNALDVDRIRRMYEILERIRREAGMAVPVDLATVAAFLTDSGSQENPLRGEEMWNVLRPAVEGALVELVATRTREGLALRSDLAERAENFSGIVDHIALAVVPVPGRFARRLEDRLAALRDEPGFDGGRVAQEIALMAERLDVTEELLRLKTHLEHFRQLLDVEGAVGRKLDFVIQEIGREINTVGSKAQDAVVAGRVIDGKAELEKIREQAQNIE